VQVLIDEIKQKSRTSKKKEIKKITKTRESIWNFQYLINRYSRKEKKEEEQEKKE
jgi:hypothetical protein